MRIRLIASILTILAFGAGCGSPCDEVADIACKAAGDESVECKELREKAARADGETKGYCETALAFRDGLSKAR